MAWVGRGLFQLLRQQAVNEKPGTVIVMKAGRTIERNGTASPPPEAKSKSSPVEMMRGEEAKPRLNGSEEPLGNCNATHALKMVGLSILPNFESKSWGQHPQFAARF